MSTELAEMLDNLSFALKNGRTAMALNAIGDIAPRLDPLREQLRSELRTEHAARIAAVTTGTGASHDWDVADEVRCRRCHISVLGPHVIERGQLPACSDTPPCSLDAHLVGATVGGSAGYGRCIYCDTTFPATNLVVSGEVPVQ
jgi:hypothetical protein